MMDYAATFLPLYDKRNSEHVEICLIKDEILMFFEKFGVVKPNALEELDYLIMNQMQKATLIDDVVYTLNELHKQGIIMYIRSNSIFTGNSAEKLLKEFGILHYFKKKSSADYGIRKHCPKFYQVAIDELLFDNPNKSKRDILYVGND